MQFNHRPLTFGHYGAVFRPPMIAMRVNPFLLKSKLADGGCISAADCPSLVLFTVQLHYGSPEAASRSKPRPG